MKEFIKKLKTDLERKEVALKNTKLKLDQALTEIDSLKTESINKTSMSMQEIDKESRKHDQTRISLKKLEGQYNMLIFLVKRIFRESFLTCQKLKSKFAQ